MTRLLYIDDDSIDRMTFERTLKKLPCKVNCQILNDWPKADFNWDNIDFLLSDVNIGSKTVIEFFGEKWQKPTVLFSGTPFNIRDKHKGLYNIKEVVMKPITVSKISSLFDTYGLMACSSQVSRIDMDYLDNLSGGEEDFKNEMLNIFKDEMPAELKHLSALIIKQNWDLCASQIHKMKSKYRIMGMRKEGELAYEIEVAFKAGEVDDDLHQKIQLLFGNTQMAIKEVNDLIEKGV